MPPPPNTCHVLHVITDLSSGGAQRMLTHVVSAAPAAGAPRHHVVSLTDDGVYGAVLRRTGVPVTCLTLRGLAGMPRALLALTRIIRRERPDIVQTWLYHADFLGLVATCFVRPRPPVVWNVRCSDMDLHAYAWTTRVLVRLLAHLSRRPAAVMVNSIAGQRWHDRLGYRPRRWLVCPNGFPTDRLRPDAAVRARRRADLGLPEATVVFVCAARVDPMKDHGNLLAAFDRVRKRLPCARLMLLGQGTKADTGSLEPLAADPDLAAGVLRFGETTDGYAEILQAADVFVLPSAFGEGFPNVLGEAMCLELPCVATDVGDAAAIVGETGRIVPPRAPDALAWAMIELAELGGSDRRTLGRAARERILATYDLDSVRQRYARLYRRLSRIGQPDGAALPRAR